MSGLSPRTSGVAASSFHELVDAPPPPRDAVLALATGINKAGLDLLAALAAERPAAASVWVSPYSVGTAMLMLATGLSDAAAAEVYRTLLHVPTSITLPETVATQAALSSILGGSGSSTDGPTTWVTISNSLWVVNAFKATPAFRDVLQRLFHAEVGSVDGGNLSPINDWISEKTKGLITDVVPKSIEKFAAALVNAVYFNGKWAQQFDPAQTLQTQTFFGGDGIDGGRKVPLMRINSTMLAYAEVAGVGQAIRLPYTTCEGCEAGSAAAYSAVVILPPPGVSPEAALTALRAQGGSVGERLSMKRGDLSLPRFTARMPPASLKSTLRKLGVQLAFKSVSGLDLILEPRTVDSVYVSDVLHSVVVKVDEEGTVAAAVTVVLMAFTTSVELPPEPFNMRVDRPFVFLVEDGTTGALLFAGIVREP